MEEALKTLNEEQLAAYNTYVGTWNAAIDEVLKIWDDIGPNETDVEIGERFRSLKK